MSALSPAIPHCFDRRSTIDLGDLPVATINKALGHDLEPGRLLLEQGALRHIAERHGDDLHACRHALCGHQGAPHFVGQTRSIENRFELVWGFADPIVMVVVGRAWWPGIYCVVTGYCITRDRLDKERRAGTLVRILSLSEVDNGARAAAGCQG
jgi:hypothetical protein